MDLIAKYKRALDLEAEVDKLVEEIWLELEKHGKRRLLEFHNLKAEVERQHFDGQMIEPPGLISALIAYEVADMKHR